MNWFLVVCPIFPGQCSINQKGKLIDKVSARMGVVEWKNQELIHRERLEESKASDLGEGCRESAR